MNRKNLNGPLPALAALAAAAALAGCASAPVRQETARESASTAQEAAPAVDTARSVWAECVRGAVSRLDVSEAPADALAHLAMKGCSDQYTDMANAVARTLAPKCSRDPDCTRGVLAKVEREATQAATAEVQAERVRVSAAGVLKCQ